MKYLVLVFVLMLNSSHAIAKSVKQKKEAGRTIASVVELSPVSNHHHLATRGQTELILEKPQIEDSANSSQQKSRLNFERGDKSVPRKGVLSPAYRSSEVSIRYQ